MGQALASALYAGNHWGMPCTTGQSRLNQLKLLGIKTDRLTTSEHSQSCLGSPSVCSTMSGSSITYDYVQVSATQGKQYSHAEEPWQSCRFWAASQ